MATNFKKKNVWRDHIWHFSNLPTLIAVLSIAFFWVYAEDQRSELFLQSQRNEVLAQANVARAEIERTINSNLQLVKGLVSVISSEPNMDQVRFAFLSRALFEDSHQLRSLAAAPDLKVQLVYPYVGNESVIGLDYNKTEVQREAALRARDSDALVLAGPVNLVQGGRGFIGRYPVFIRTANGERNFWGLVSAVIDEQRLLEDSGLLDDSLGLDVALKGHDALGAEGDIFFGNKNIENDKPIAVDVNLPSGGWVLLAKPKQGWGDGSAAILGVRLFFAIVTIFILIPMLYSAHLVRLRSRQADKLETREQQLELLNERLKVALSASSIGVWEANLATGEQYWDERTNDLFGRTENLSKRNDQEWANALHPDDRAAAEQEFAKAVATKGNLNAQFRIILPNGQVRHLHSRCSYYHPEDADPKMVGVNWDITEEVQLKNEVLERKKLAEEQNTELAQAHKRIEHLAMHDELTGLPNRRLLDQHLSMMGNNLQPGSNLCILSIDLDLFKQINDTLGHRAGDATLCYFASILRANAPKNGFIGRIGGDEFVLAIESDDDTEKLGQLAQRIIDAANKPLMFEGHACRFGASIGIANIIEPGEDYSNLLVKSDIALYRAKQDGRNCFVFFTRELQANIVRSRQLSDDIIKGIEAEEFLPFYQPQFDAHSLKIIGVEALARWHHPTKGLLTPYHFLEGAQEIGMMDRLDHLILEKVLQDMKMWEQHGIDIPNVAVNVSSSRLEDNHLIDALSQFEIEPGKLTFELVETIFLDESKEIVDENLAKIQNMGIDIDIDDFGTGHASIVGLLRLHPKRLKIDRQFVAPLAESGEQRRLIKSIIDMGKSLNIEVLAEGVEEEEQVRILRLLGCDALQGYLFGKPMPADAMVRYVNDHNATAQSPRIISI